jgi:hypothetical protein
MLVTGVATTVTSIAATSRSTIPNDTSTTSGGDRSYPT